MLNNAQLQSLNQMMASFLEPDYRSVQFFKTLINELEKEVKDPKDLIQVAILIAKAMGGGVVASSYFAMGSENEMEDAEAFMNSKDYEEELHLIELLIGHLLVRKLEKRLPMDTQEVIPGVLEDCREEIQKAVYKLNDRFQQ